jgi:hypothetical protein
MTTATTPVFAKGDTNRCLFKTESGRQCKLETHPDTTTHKFVNRTAKAPVALSTLVPAGFSLAATDVPQGGALKKQTNRKDTAPRDTDQKHVDKDALAAYGKYAAVRAKTGKYVEFTDAPLKEYIVPVKAVDAVLDMLRRAVGSGGPTAIAGKTMRYRKGTHSSGNVRIQYAIMDTAPPKPKSPVAAAPAPAPATDATADQTS